MLEHVCFDLDGISSWDYNPEEKIYYRDRKDGKHTGAISGVNLPNPEVLWQNRLGEVRKIKGEVTLEDMTRNKPSNTTYLLWMDWQKRNEKCP